MIKKFKITVVVPAYNEEKNIPFLNNELIKILSYYEDYEIIYVDDGSTDCTLLVIKELIKENGKIKYLTFSRNFGHQQALRAGIEFSTGDCVISLDSDLQHPTELINKLIEKWKEGYEIVSTSRLDLHSPIFKKVSSKLFYFVINLISDTKVTAGSADFRLIDRKVVKILNDLTEYDIFFRGIIQWIGFKQCFIEYIPNDRLIGKSKYTFRKMLRFARIGIVSLSVKPLHLSTIVGIFSSLLSFLYGIYAILIYIFNKDTVPGWTSVIVCVLFLGGVQLFTLGIIGEYLGKLFNQSRQRPKYIVKDKNI